MKPMDERRRPRHAVTPSYEDTGLFKTGMVQLVVELVPFVSQNARRDILVRGFVQGSAITVVFAGRRAAKARPIVSRLQRMARQVKHAQTNPNDLRLPLRIEGAWRKQFGQNDDGWSTRHYYFIAARWLLVGADGMTEIYGEPQSSATSKDQ